MWFKADFLVTIVPIFAGIAAAALLVFIIIKCVHSSRKFKQTIQSPVERYEAVVLEKTAAEKHRRTFSGEDMTSLDTEVVTQYRVTFRLETEEPKTLAVPEEVFSLMGEGDRGVLTFQKEQFLKFERF